ncbi:MAG: ABC transporter ATP-binding protein [Rhodocyclaceae bacterium]|nr:ABC transporter ATP-binding protein [Rhodocyclaceae bacterium]MCA3025790.1 ABC transporter ATP-binding protein [Rhodocyclaceae bacterium]MCA3031823.1 ABC transporter ATP-binding protein [Rhodocyclaceae bacterium]MCA3038115.1 ABC transporter ATP-binding protein [Rhodocyclaceae bacterium]MCA3045716.1 ABC transporter ATP-binding protein [Rhodocyclaceae bacterium]
MSALTLRGITKKFGKTETIHGIDLDINGGEFVVFVGPSGCGKSTLLRMIAGLDEVTAGAITIGGRDVTTQPPSERKVAMVFQSYALYPHMTVAENLSFGMRMRGVAKHVIAQRVQMAVEMLRLAPYLNRKPGALSGGQCQRVAIGRALVQEPDVFLFDEPLSNLDAELRLKTRVEIAALHKRLGKTMVYVTHDQVEAMTLADKIVVLRDGMIEQVGKPLDLYHAPANLFVAGFIGSPAMNFLASESFSGDALQGPLQGYARDSRVKTIGIRSEHLVISAHGPIVGVVTAIERLGTTTYVYFEKKGQSLCAQVADALELAVGGNVQFHVADKHVHGFDAAGLRIAKL